MRRIFGHSGHGLSAARFSGRLIEQLEVDEALAAVTQRGADAVGAGVAAADHDDALVPRVDELPVLEVAVEQALGVRGQELHREMDAA